MMITDGYTRHYLLKSGPHEFNVWYRPATRGERRWFERITSRLGQTAAEFHAFAYVAKHLVASDFTSPTFDYREVKVFEKYHTEAFEMLLKAIQGLIPDTSGEVWSQVEMAWRQNLIDGVLLERTDPKLARRSCESCQKYWYLSNGEILKDARGELQLLQGLTACKTELGCPKGTPENQRCLNAANRAAYRHFLECDAIGQFPDDAIIRTNAAIIRKALAVPVKKKGAA